MGVIVVVIVLNGRPDLHVWHHARMESEYTASGDVKSFEDYVAMEDQLFEELDREVYQKIDEADKRQLNDEFALLLEAEGQ